MHSPCSRCSKNSQGLMISKHQTSSSELTRGNLPTASTSLLSSFALRWQCACSAGGWFCVSRPGVEDEGFRVWPILARGFTHIVVVLWAFVGWPSGISLRRRNPVKAQQQSIAILLNISDAQVMWAVFALTRPPPKRLEHVHGLNWRQDGGIFTYVSGIPGS